MGLDTVLYSFVLTTIYSKIAQQNFLKYWGIKQLLTLIGMMEGIFHPLVFFGSDFDSWVFFYQKFPIFFNSFLSLSASLDTQDTLHGGMIVKWKKFWQEIPVCLVHSTKVFFFTFCKQNIWDFVWFVWPSTISTGKGTNLFNARLKLPQMEYFFSLLHCTGIRWGNSRIRVIFRP